MLILLYIVIFVYCMIGAFAGTIISFQGEWPHDTDKVKTAVAFIAFGPIFWFLTGLLFVFMNISEWLTKK